MIDNIIGQIHHFICWFFYYRHGKIKYRVFDYGDTYMATASDGTATVANCYGSTPEDAKRLALYRLKKFKERESSL